MRMFGRGILVAGLALALANCDGCKSSNMGSQTLKYIDNELTAQVGLGKLTAVKCDPAPEKPKVGDSFNCTATTPDGKVLKIVSKLVAEGKAETIATNVLKKEMIVPVLTSALPAIKEQAGQDVEVSNVDCGNKNIVLDADNSFDCMVTVPSTGAKYKGKFTLDTRDNSITTKIDAPMPAQPASEPEEAPEGDAEEEEEAE